MFKYPGAKAKNQRKQQQQQQHHHHQHHRPIPTTTPPPLSDPGRWFDHFDRDRSGSLDREEVVSALVQTFAASGQNRQSQHDIRDTVYNVWPAFDRDGNGTIDRREFCAPGGMGESLQAMMQQHNRPHPQHQHQQQNNPYDMNQMAAAVPQVYVPNYANSTPTPSSSVQQQSSASTPGVYVPQAYQQHQHQNYNQPQPSAPPPPPPHAPHYTPPPPAQPPHQPQNHTHHQTSQPQPQKAQTMRVTIPAGMKPGQKIKVQSQVGPDTIVTIPPKHQWHETPGARHQHYFDFQMPLVVQGTVVSANATATQPGGAGGHGTAYNYGGGPSGPTGGRAPIPWQSWETFRGRSYQPPPLGMRTVHTAPLGPGGMRANVPASGRRKALLIGINYRGTRAALRGCVNDARNMRDLLVGHGFRDDSTHMVMLVDEGGGRDRLPTRSNIMKGFQWLVQGATEGDVLFFHFSGHGAQVADKTGHEADGYNETILPLDYKKAGQITDDEIWGSLVYPLPSGVRLTALMDCCHSGTGMDVPFEYNFRLGQWREDVNPAHSQGDVILFSGCEDSQTSADTFDRYQAGGAMTQSFISAYKQNPMATYPDLMAAIHKSLRKRRFTQRPQLTTSQRFDARSRVFSFVEGIEPNGNHEVGRKKRKHVRPGRPPSGGLNDLLFQGAAVAGAFVLFNEILN